MEIHVQAFNLRAKWEQDTEQFGRLEPLRSFVSECGRRRWVCRCLCGNEVDCRQSDLISGAIKSCGCLRREVTSTLVGRRGVVHNRLAEGEASCRALYRRYWRGAKERGITWDLSLGLFRDLTSRDCYICGQKPSQVYQHGSAFGAYVYNGIDRIDNSRGYEPDNVAPCCAICNQFKTDRDHEWVLAHALRIVQYNRLEEDHGKR